MSQVAQGFCTELEKIANAVHVGYPILVGPSAPKKLLTLRKKTRRKQGYIRDKLR